MNWRGFIWPRRPRRRLYEGHYLRKKGEEKQKDFCHLFSVDKILKYNFLASILAPSFIFYLKNEISKEH